jgi:signal transduction histidine kinase
MATAGGPDGSQAPRGAVTPGLDCDRAQHGLLSSGRLVSEMAHPSRATPATRDLTPALYRAAVALGRTWEAAEVLRVAIAETQRAAGLETVALYVFDPGRQALVLKEFAGTTAGFQDRMRILPLAGWGPDAGSTRPDEIIATPVAEHPTPELRAAFAEHGFRYVTMVPVAGQDQTLGMLCLASRDPIPLSSEESALVQAIGGLVGIALENATLREQLMAHQERLKALAGGILQAREEEARRIAHELHDEAGQLLATLHITLDELEWETPAQDTRFKNLRLVLDRVETQLRRLARELRPTILDDLGLAPALEWLAQGLADRKDVIVTVAAPESRLAPRIETALFRIVQEALSNAVRHARPRRIAVEVREEGPRIEAVVRDDGQGFDVASALARRGDRGLGLIGMRERAQALGGTLEIRSAPNQGTELCVVIPREVSG